MIATAHATVAANGVLAEVRSEPPLTLRQVRAEQEGTCALCLVGSAAGPLAGDERTLRVTALPGARATITAAGAQLAQGRDADCVSTCRTELVLGEQATLTGDTGPLIVAAGARTHVEVSITVAATARLDWREVVVLGRSAEPLGRALIRWDVVRDGTPLLRQSVDLTGEPGLLLAGRRVLASCLLTGPGLAARTVVRHATAAAAKLADDAVLITVLAADAAAAANDLQALRAAVAIGA
ncbi:MAG TPA: urease accessory protein UreD [Mycobacteriales bacterium]